MNLRVMEQVIHWLHTPTNTYLGSDYGIDLKSELQKPMLEFDADGIIAKLRNDVPVLGLLPPEQVNIFVEDTAIDQKTIYLQIADNIINLSKLEL